MLERWWRGDVSERSIGKDFGVENDVTYMENTSGFLLLENRCSFRVLFSDLPIYNSVYSILSTLRLVMTTLLLFCCWACPTLVTPDYNLPDSSVLGISQARILEWVAISFSRGYSWPRTWARVSCTAGGFFTTKSPRKPIVTWSRSSWERRGIQLGCPEGCFCPSTHSEPQTNQPTKQKHSPWNIL